MRTLAISSVLCAVISCLVYARETGANTVGARYPYLCSGALRDAVITDLKDGAIVSCDGFIASAGRRHSIRISGTWLAAQANKWAKNPVESARLSGKPTLVNFSVIGCCDRTYPIVQELQSEYNGRVNVIFVNIEEEEILSDLYGVTSIPVQMLFDKDGKEVFRHTGFLPKDRLVAEFAKIGVS